MPKLQFKGKQFVYDHQLTVHYHALVIDERSSLAAPKGGIRHHSNVTTCRGTPHHTSAQSILATSS